LHPISDKAEVSVDFPDKAYIGSFGRHSNSMLLADILLELAKSLASRDQLDEQHRSELSEAAKQLSASLEPRAKS
jgi:hypothetical protein